MKPADISRLLIPGRPALPPDGDLLVAIDSPDPETNRYAGSLHRIRLNLGESAEPFTHGDRDSAPVISPDGSAVVFLRAVGDGRPQLYVMPLRGGDARKLTDHPLGAGAATFSADGSRIVYVAAVPEAGRYGTDSSVAAEAEAPRRITRRAYRSDGRGFVIDQPEQVFVWPTAGWTRNSLRSRCRRRVTSRSIRRGPYS